MTLRISSHPLLQVPEAREVGFTFAGKSYSGLEGEPVATALLASGVRLLRQHEASGNPRGLYCAIGHCMECRVRVSGRGVVRACLTPLEAGMRIEMETKVPNLIDEEEPR